MLTGAGGNFCSGGDVLEIIGPLTERDMKGLLAFTRMTGDVVKAIRACPQPVIAAIDGVCVGAGACLAIASDLRLGTPEAKTAFLFVRVGLAGCDMGACALLPRIIGQGRAAELLLTGRSMDAEEGLRWGFYNRLCPREQLLDQALELAAGLAAGPTFAHMMTKTMLNQEWSMSLEAAIEAEAQAQAICMQTEDFRRAYRAFVAKRPPGVRGQLNAALAMPDRSYLAWPFFEERHRALAGEVERFAAGSAGRSRPGADDVDATCRMLVRQLAEAGLLRHVVPAAYGGVADGLDVRSLCLVRETLARFASLADFAFAMQGLGSGAITLFGTEEQRRA